MAAKKTKHNCISIITGLGYTFIRNGAIGQITKKLYRYAFRNNQRVIFENNDDRIFFIEEKIIKEKNAISVKGCGININYFSPQKITKNNHHVVFLFIGRLLSHKGIREFIEAAKIVQAENKKCKFIVAGDIDEDNPATISKLELNKWINEGIIEYKGFLHDIREVIQEADCIVLPSYREAIARALQEGMAMAKPVISTDVAGCREAVENNINGFLVPVKTIQPLADAMIRFSQLSEEEKNKMGERGRKKVVKEFDEKIIAHQVLSVINNVVWKN